MTDWTIFPATPVRCCFTDCTDKANENDEPMHVMLAGERVLLIHESCLVLREEQSAKQVVAEKVRLTAMSSVAKPSSAELVHVLHSPMIKELEFCFYLHPQFWFEGPCKLTLTSADYIKTLQPKFMECEQHVWRVSHHSLDGPRLQGIVSQAFTRFERSAYAHESKDERTQTVNAWLVPPRLTVTDTARFDLIIQVEKGKHDTVKALMNELKPSGTVITHLRSFEMGYIMLTKSVVYYQLLARGVDVHMKGVYVMCGDFMEPSSVDHMEIMGAPPCSEEMNERSSACRPMELAPLWWPRGMKKQATQWCGAGRPMDDVPILWRKHISKA